MASGGRADGTGGGSQPSPVLTHDCLTPEAGRPLTTGPQELVSDSFCSSQSSSGDLALRLGLTLREAEVQRLLSVAPSLRNHGLGHIAVVGAHPASPSTAGKSVLLTSLMAAAAAGGACPQASDKHRPTSIERLLPCGWTDRCRHKPDIQSPHSQPRSGP